MQFVGEVQPAPSAAVLIGGWGIRMTARTARWVAGCAAAASVALLGAGLVLSYVDRQLVPASLTGWTVSNVSGQVVNMAVPVSGFVLASRRPENRIGWLFLVAGLALGVSGFSPGYAQHALAANPGSLPAGRVFAWLSNWVWVIAVAMLAFLFLLFPTGQLHSRRWRPAAWFAGVAFALATVCTLIAASSEWAHPFALSGPANPGGLTALFFLMAILLISAALLVSVAALVVRFAKSSDEERLQLKWCAAAALVTGRCVRRLDMGELGGRERASEPGVRVPVDGHRHRRPEVPAV